MFKRLSLMGFLATAVVGSHITSVYGMNDEEKQQITRAQRKAEKNERIAFAQTKQAREMALYILKDPETRAFFQLHLPDSELAARAYNPDTTCAMALRPLAAVDPELEARLIGQIPALQKKINKYKTPEQLKAEETARKAADPEEQRARREYTRSQVIVMLKNECMRNHFELYLPDHELAEKACKDPLEAVISLAAFEPALESRLVSQISALQERINKYKVPPMPK
jgi:hypothetical protein